MNRSKSTGKATPKVVTDKKGVAAKKEIAKNDILAVNNEIVAKLSKDYKVRMLSCGNISVSSNKGHLLEIGVRLTTVKALIKNKLLYEVKGIEKYQASTPKQHPFGIDFQCSDIYGLLVVLNKELNKSSK